jgi:hypothetical protein
MWRDRLWPKAGNQQQQAFIHGAFFMPRSDQLPMLKKGVNADRARKEKSWQGNPEFKMKHLRKVAARNGGRPIKYARDISYSEAAKGRSTRVQLEAVPPQWRAARLLQVGETKLLADTPRSNCCSNVILNEPDF